MPAWIDHFIVVSTAALVIVTVVPAIRAPHWAIRMWDFPRVQASVLALLIMVVSAFGIRPGAVSNQACLVLAGACLLWHLSWIWPYTRLHRREVPSAAMPAASDTLRLMCANVLMHNQRVPGLIATIRSYRPDIVVTLETNERWQRELRVIHDDYPHRLACPLENLYGMHVFAKMPLIDPKIQFLVESDIPSMHMMISPWSDGRDIHLHFLHPAPPSPTENDESTERDAELLVVAKAVRDCDAPLIVAGDLNDVAWSRTTRLFRKISGLMDPRIGRGMFNSFHARWPFFRFPLDHVFVSSHFSLVRMKRLPTPGSDHFAIFVELVLAGKDTAEATIEDADHSDQAEAEESIENADVHPADVHRPGVQRTVFQSARARSLEFGT
ncbi:MAG: endonuclease/exonuclease/phosphatase family protein [Burkholderiaceae bacterium]